MMIARLHRIRAWLLLSLLAPACGLGGIGCFSLDTTGTEPTARAAHAPPAKPAVAGACQVTAFWVPSMSVTNDVLNNGAPLQGLVGRVYLTAAESRKMCQGQGKIKVDLYDPNTPGSDGKPMFLRGWVFDKGSLDMLFRYDGIDWGYTLFLPWPEYDGSVKRVNLQVCYIPDKGSPLYGQRSDFVIRNVSVSRSERTMLPGQAPGQPPMAPAQVTGNIHPELAVPAQRN